MNYEEMSDFAINQSVTREVLGRHDWEINSCGDFYHCGADGSGYYVQTVRDYCNNPSDAWPIIESIFWDLMAADELGVTEWARCIRKEDCSDKLRAAMIVFLMMKGAECLKP